ncbi:hypothetical protein PG999_014183 [Apiospora kogelbergensis]|uniref:Uncharacterized protein n=1 Tax=Apiospora kogelbergensis TaxID=1337665 RepID=A0AAW0Q865_9PEZI
MELFKKIATIELEQAIPCDGLPTQDDGARVEVVLDVIEAIPEAVDQYHLLLAATTSAPVSYIGYELNYPQPLSEERFPAELWRDEEAIATFLCRACIWGLWCELRRGHRVDEHLEDLLTIYQAMASGFSSTTVANESGDMEVEGFSMDSPALGPNGFKYDVDTSSIHRETSWWMAQHLAGIKLEEKTIEDNLHRGCIGLGLGEQ